MLLFFVGAGNCFASVTAKKKRTPFGVRLALVRVFITDLILRHSAGLVETYSQSAENACAYKEFCNTKGI